MSEIRGRRRSTTTKTEIITLTYSCTCSPAMSSCPAVRQECHRRGEQCSGQPEEARRNALDGHVKCGLVRPTRINLHLGHGWGLCFCVDSHGQWKSISQLELQLGLRLGMEELFICDSGIQRIADNCSPCSMPAYQKVSRVTVKNIYCSRPELEAIRS
ncbi:PREDICTED: uncharacterized protein LOC108612459 [Drosophila arizonae]|uniref:Uncharacterized protein LOC108612459 n=1 Tax=Drosophila arizonae TaxID=7263 RepID=A0ABM1P0U4_DROAR|nr:PREDICTED: uncharacterized protein LOC108612459 [Drosophila arizonae]